ncbi:MAG: GNAT family N-acetyltransferase [Candidatus Nanopelagicales bacterium]
MAEGGDDLLPGIVSLMRAHEAAVLGHTNTSVVEAESEVRAPEVDRERSVVAVDDGRVVGLRLVMVDLPERDVLLDCWTHPQLDERDQRGLMARLVTEAWPTARSLARVAEAQWPPPEADPWQASPATWQLAGGAYRQDEVWAEALASLGLRQVRTFQRMSLVHGTEVPLPPAPDGVTARQIADEDDLRVAHRIHQQAFADHWGGEPERTFADWLTDQRAQPGFDPALWSIAELRGTAVGLCVGSDARRELGVAYVPLLGVVREARGRGIARYLLRREFHRSALRGYGETQLTVDSESLTGADRLYRSVGMAPTVTIDAWLAPITGAGPPECE